MEMLVKDLSASVQHLFRVVASVLHLGNVHFDADSKGHALLKNNTELNWVSDVSKAIIPETDIRSMLRNVFDDSFQLSLQLLGVDANNLKEGLRFRNIEAKTEQVIHRQQSLFYPNKMIR